MTKQGFDFSPELGNVGRKRPVKSFTLSNKTIDGLKKMQKLHPEINISNWVERLIENALKEDISPVVFVGVREKFKPVTLLLRNELADFINALLLTGGYGLGLAKRVTPLTVGEKITKAILNAPLFLAGDMEIHGNMENELLNAKDNAKMMMKEFDDFLE